MFLPVFVCLSVYLLAKLLKSAWMKCCVSTGVGTWTNWLIFEPVRMPEPYCFLRYRISAWYKRCYAEFYVGKISRIHIGGPPLQRGVVLKLFYSLSRRNTFVGGTCALPSVLIVYTVNVIQTFSRPIKWR